MVSLVELGVALTAVALAGAAAHRWRQSVIPAYILAGVVVGPNAPTAIAGVPTTLVRGGEVIDALAELGVVLLLFFLGLEFSVNVFVENWSRLAGVGILDLVVNLGLGLVLGVAFGLSPLATLFVAGVVYISSSAVITKSLVDQGWVADPEAEVVLGTLVFEDVVIAVYLALLSAVALGGGGIREAAVSVGVAFVLLGALAAVAWRGGGLVERAFAADSDELFLLRVLGVTVLVAGVALAAGVSEAVAAFFVGSAFSTTAHAERIEATIAPVRDLFAAAFFFAIGLATDLRGVGAVAPLLAAAIVLTTAGKLASGTGGGHIYGLGPRRSLRVGIGLVARGEFSLVIGALAATAGRGVGELGATVPAFAVGYVLAMSVLGTVLMSYADELTRPVLARLASRHGEEGLSGE